MPTATIPEVEAVRIIGSSTDAKMQTRENGSTNTELNPGGHYVVPFTRFQHQAVDWLGIMHRKHTAHILMEVDVTEVLNVMRRNSIGDLQHTALAAFVTTCFAQAIGENKRLQAYRKGRDKLILFDDVDIAALINQAEQPAKSPSTHSIRRTPHIIREANRKSLESIEQEILYAQAAKPGQPGVTLWLPFWLILPSALRKLVWVLLLNNPRMKKKITGTAAVSFVNLPGVATEASRWAIPLTAYTLALDLGGIVRRPGVMSSEGSEHGEHNESVQVRDYLCMTLSRDDDIIDVAQAARFAERLKELVEGGPSDSALTQSWLKPGEHRQNQESGSLHGTPDTPDRSDAAIMMIKSIHTAIFFGMGSCVVYLVYSGLVGRLSWLAKVTMLVLTGEGVIYARNGFRCPLADMAEDLGSEHGTVGDIFLPNWFAKRIPIFSSVLLGIALAAYLLRRVVGRQIANRSAIK